ncbi:MAG: phage tail protein [Enterobacteriaceae bacterium]|nr:phage tail protein [Enterobacteriaceae bacterium]
MAAKYFALLTERGAVKIAQATALGTQVKITQMAIGDGGGFLPVPSSSQTKLVNERRRAVVNSLSIDPLNSSQIIAEQIIPEDEGGFWIREIGLYDDAGELIAVANCAETYKPVLSEGSGRTQVIRMVLIVSSTDAVTLKIDPSVVLATRKYVDDQDTAGRAYTDNLMSIHINAIDPHPQYAPRASPVFTGTPKAPTPVPTANDTSLATTAFVKAALASLIGSAPAALDTLNELAAALGNDANFAATMTSLLANKQPLNSTLTALSGKDVAGLLKYLGLNETGGAFQAVGSYQLGGMIFKSGSNSATVTNSGYEFKFPTPFPNTCYALVVTGWQNPLGHMGRNNIGATILKGSANDTIGFDWIAMGV